MADWKGFLDEIKKEPKNFAKAVVVHLKPPKYVLEELKKFDWMCHFCWQPRVDVCCSCYRSICEGHTAKTLIGPKTKLEWYFCPDCVRTMGENKMLETVKAQDEEFWLEDQEDQEKQSVKRD